MRTLLFTLFALGSFASGYARADRDLIWTPDTTLYFSARVAFERVRVIDNRDIRTRIGWLKTGAFNRYANLVTGDSLHTVMTQYANRLLRTARRQQGELVVVLRSFWLEDQKGSEEIGTVHLRADLFRSTGASQYWHVRSLDTFYETKSGWDVSSALKRKASQAIADMLQAGSGARQSEKIYPLDDMAGRQTAALHQWPVYSDAAPAPGIYASLDDFLNLRVSDLGFIMKHNRGTGDGPEYRFFFKNAKGRQGKEIGPDVCFAIFDGKMWYLAHREGFSRMPQQAKEFYALQPMRGLTDNSLMIGMLFGGVASTIAGADRGKHYTWYVTRLEPEYRKFALIKRAR